MEITKDKITPLMVTLSGIKNGKEVGLLHEKIGFTAKRLLSKIHKELIPHYNELQEDVKEIQKLSEEEQIKAAEDLAKETITLNYQKVRASELDGIVSEVSYDFDLIELISE